MFIGSGRNTYMSRIAFSADKLLGSPLSFSSGLIAHVCDRVKNMKENCQPVPSNYCSFIILVCIMCRLREIFIL